jgi:hypothetical protein
VISSTYLFASSASRWELRLDGWRNVLRLAITFTLGTRIKTGSRDNEFDLSAGRQQE